MGPNAGSGRNSFTRLDGPMDADARIAPLRAAACPGAHGARCVCDRRGLIL